MYRPINDPVTTSKLVKAIADAYRNGFIPSGEVRIPAGGEAFLKRDYSLCAESNGRTSSPRVILESTEE